MKNKINFNR